MYTFEDQSSQIGWIFIFPSILYFNMPHINNHFLPPLLALMCSSDRLMDDTIR